MPISLWHRTYLPTYLASSLSLTHNASTLPRQPALFLAQAFARSHYPHPVCSLSFSTILRWVLGRPTFRFPSGVLDCCHTVMSCLHAYAAHDQSTSNVSPSLRAIPILSLSCRRTTFRFPSGVLDCCHTVMSCLHAYAAHDQSTSNVSPSLRAIPILSLSCRRTSYANV